MKLCPMINLDYILFSLCRPDRNKYLDVNTNNVVPGALRQYDVPTPAELRALEKDIPYDYFSIMHYGKDFFGRRGADVSMNNVTFLVA